MRKNINCVLTIAIILTLSGCGINDDENGEVITTPDNRPPNSFSLLTVSSGADGVELKPTLVWEVATDPDNDPVTYDLVMDNNTSPNTLIASNLDETEFTFNSSIQSSEVYYWKVIAKDNHGKSTESSIFSFTTIDLYSQTTDVITGLSGPRGIVLDGDDLYIAEVDGNKVSKINVSASNPSATDVVTGLYTFRLALSGNQLYISQPQANLISKIDNLATTPTVAPVMTGINGPSGLAFDENDLYVAESDIDKIIKLDISATSPNATDVSEIGFISRPDGLLLNGNDLYIALRTGNKVSKIDISATTPMLIDVATGLSGPNALALDGNTLYIAEYDGNKVSKIDISSTTTTVTDVVTGLSGPGGLAFNGNVLYIAEYIGNKISKIHVQ